MPSPFLNTVCDPSGIVTDLATPPAPFHTDSEAGPEDLAGAKLAAWLLDHGHFLQALALTKQEIPALRQEGPIEDVLTLWYVRIQCLLILQQGHVAAEEIGHNLYPLDSETTRKEALVAPEHVLAAWRLRLLLVPVKTKGINQAAVQSYYSLGLEAREGAARFADHRAEWFKYLELSGLYAASTLIALRDYTTALSLLRAEYAASKDAELIRALAMLHIYLGDSLGAQAWAGKLEEGPFKNKLQGLIRVVEHEPAASEDEKSGLAELSKGDVDEALDIMEARAVARQTENGQISNVSLSNLFWLYGLCFADVKPRYRDVAEKLKHGRNLELQSTELTAEFARVL